MNKQKRLENLLEDMNENWETRSGHFSLGEVSKFISKHLQDYELVEKDRQLERDFMKYSEWYTRWIEEMRDIAIDKLN